MKNVTKDRLRAGKLAFGFQVRSVRTLDIVRAVATSGYHYLNIDLEHSTMDVDMAAQLCVACLGEKITSVVRVPSHAPEIGARLLDSGAQGIIIPHVQNAEQARFAVREYLVPPLGTRADGGGVLTGWSALGTKERFGVINDSTLIAVMVESAEAIRNVDEIAAVDGVDVIVVGTHDLAADLGIIPDSEDPRMLEAYMTVLAAAKRHGKAVRLGGEYDPKLLARSIELGARFITVTGDIRVLVGGMRTALSDVRERAKSLGGIVD